MADTSSNQTKQPSEHSTKTGTDLAQEMLERQQGSNGGSNDDQAKFGGDDPAGSGDSNPDTADETAASDDLADTLTSLQNVIERGAHQLEGVNRQLKEKRESLRDVFTNDQELGQAEEQAQLAAQQAKQRKTSLQADPQVTSLQVQIGELREQQSELKETLSNHLVNYYQLTNSKSFDTSDGDQWEFEVKARVKPRRKSKE